MRFVAPLLFLLLALVMQAAMDASVRAEGRYRPQREGLRTAVGPVPDCNADLYIGARPCVSLVFTPNTSQNMVIKVVRTALDL